MLCRTWFIHYFLYQQLNFAFNDSITQPKVQKVEMEKKNLDCVEKQFFGEESSLTGNMIFFLEISNQRTT